MNKFSDKQEALFSYPVWDRQVRLFHWLNVLCIIGLMGVGVALLYNKDLGVSSDGKILLKTVHVYLGYLFVFNLLWRLLWGFFANRYSRWKAVLPFGRGYLSALIAYIKGFAVGQAPAYAGHNPVAKLLISLMFVLLTTQAITGLVLAGTDLYFPPFGQKIAEWISIPADEGDKLTAIKSGSMEGVDPGRYQEMRAFRKPFVRTHEYTFYILLIMIIIHIAGVVITELKERCGLISAMFSGDKFFSTRPVDVDDEDI